MLCLALIVAAAPLHAEKYACRFDGGFFADFYVDIYNSEILYLEGRAKHSDFTPDFVDMFALADFENGTGLEFDYRSNMVKLVDGKRARYAQCQLAFNPYP